MLIGFLRILALGVLLCPVFFTIAECGASEPTPAVAAVKPPSNAEAKAAPVSDAMANSRAAEQRLLLRQREEAQRVIHELSQRLAESSDPQVHRDLLRQIMDAKREARLEFLRTKAAFARGRGEFELAERIDQVIENMILPRLGSPVPAPGKDKAVARKDGQP